MADKAVPDISSKLSAPKKISGFEKQRQDAEAKRLREEAENRAALREFESSFADADDDDDDNHDDPIAQLAAGRGAFGGGPGGARDGYVRGAPMRNSGPGTLGPPAGPPPPSLKRKRELDQERERTQRRDDRTSPEPAAKRPTVLLSSLPRNTTDAAVRRLLPPTLKAADMAFVPAANRRCLAAVVALAPDTASSDIDAAVNQLQQRYLGFGCHLSISKHITISSPVASVLHTATSAADLQPFGARPALREPPPHSFRNAPPPDMAPLAVRHQGPAPTVVSIAPPPDLKVLAMINKTVEKLIMYGPEWECLLMAQPDVQHGEHWAWLFDNTSPAHIWYRWLVWQYYSSRPSKQSLPPHPWGVLDELAKTNGYTRLFDDGPFWLPPQDRPRYDHVESLGDLLDDSGYVSSDLDTDDEDDHIVQAQGTTDDGSVQKARYLNPYRKAKLSFFLNHLPDSTGLLCEGDVQAVTDLVVKFAGQGAEEVVDMLVTNLENPFRYSVDYSVDRGEAGPSEDEDRSEGGDYDDDMDGPRASFGMLGPEEPDVEEAPTTTTEDKPAVDVQDPGTDDNADGNAAAKDVSGAQLVGLYIISDALAATSVSGVRDAWKYRSLFESALASRNIFEKLGRMPKQYRWGRVRAEQWRSRIGVVLDCWEKENIFAPESHRRFRDVFLNPPLTHAEQRAKDAADAKEREEDMKKRWKSGDAPEEPAPAPAPAPPPQPEPAHHQQPRQRARPTAADLISAAAERPEPPPPKPAPKLSNFSISLNAAASPAGSPPAAAATDTKAQVKMGFSLGGAPKKVGAAAVPAKEEKIKAKEKVAGVFGDSDSE